MLPSEKLRLIISKTYNLDLETYAWPNDLRDFIMSIRLDKTIEDTLDTLFEVYSNGLNIGHCGLTSRYFIRNLDNASLYYGISKLLVGTKNSLDGNHAWVVQNGYIIDPTLMIYVPLGKLSELGYSVDKMVARGADAILSDYDTYENELFNFNNDPDFQEDILKLIRI